MSALRLPAVALCLALSASAPGPVLADGLGEGFAVWESSRSGDWRIWIRELDGSEPRQLSPDEAGRQHCCAHVAPDGRSVAYLSRAIEGDRYRHEVAGFLRIVGVDGAGDRLLAAPARVYGRGHRAAVWRDPETLIYVGGDGRPIELDVVHGGARELTRTAPAQGEVPVGWLVDATLRWATTGFPTFSPYDAARRAIDERPAIKGCEPYFSHDGRWGYWIARGGGPIRRMELATGEVSVLLERDDPRLDGQSYLYFPMLSPDGRLLAFGASAGKHDHFRANYDVYAVAVDPRTLDLAGDPVRLTSHPAPDRYPDVYRAPLARPTTGERVHRPEEPNYGR